MRRSIILSTFISKWLHGLLLPLKLLFQARDGAVWLRQIDAQEELKQRFAVPELSELVMETMLVEDEALLAEVLFKKATGWSTMNDTERKT